MSFTWKHGAVIAGCLVVGVAGAAILAQGPPAGGVRIATVASDDPFGAPPAMTNTAPVNASPVNAAPMVGTTTTAAPATIAADAGTLVTHLVAQGIATTRNIEAEHTNATKVSESASEFNVSPAVTVQTAASNFVTYGTSGTTVKLGSGERLAVVRDLFDTLGSSVQSDSAKLLLVAEQVSSGQKPTIRNIEKERSIVKTALPAFRKLTGKSAPNFQDPKDDLAWNTMLYRVRFTRDLAKERNGITKFKATFTKSPTTPSDWAIVRAWAYALQ